MSEQTEAAAIIATARLSTQPQEVLPGSIYLISTPGGYDRVDLTGDAYRDFPRRKAGTVIVRDVASFAQYHAKHSDEATEVFADLDAATVTAVLDAHCTAGARWQQHRVVLVMRKTDAWTAWTGQDRKMVRQDAFAEFIEEHATDVAADGPVSAADLLEIAQSFQAHTKVTFSSGKRLASGQTELVYSEDTTASAAKGKITIPSVFHLGIVPIDDCAAWKVTARFRYRIEGGALLLGYCLDDPARIFREAVQDVTEQAAEACGVVIMRGKPS